MRRTLSQLRDRHNELVLELGSLRAERDKLKAQRDAALALVEKWREDAKRLKQMYAHPQDYSDIAQQSRGETVSDCADELAAIWAEAEREG